MFNPRSAVSPVYRSISKGMSASQGMLAALVIIVVALSLYAIARSVDSQQRVAQTFIGWYEDKAGYDKAMAEQKTTHRPMLVYIYAPWCPHCKQFAADVLSAPKMKTFVKNYPHVRVAPDHGQKERAIMDDFKAEGYPAFYVVTPKGERRKIETYVTNGDHPHIKNAAEFIQSIKEATGGQ